MEVLSRAQAKEHGLIRFFTGKPCKHGHVAERHTSNDTCLVCASAREAERRTRFKKPRTITPRELAIAGGLDRYISGRSCPRGHLAPRFVSSRRCIKCSHADTVKWLHENIGYRRSKDAAKRAGRSQATPAWANLIRIYEIYENCPRGWHVDHIIPLRGTDVCGLHVETNLQYLPAIENMRKRNKHAA